MKKIFLLLALLTVSLFLFSCGNQDDENPSEYDGKTRYLNVYNWGEYIADGFEGSYDTNAAFEKYYFEKTGQRVKVVYSTYATNEDMYAKIAAGAGTYDIIIPSDYMIQKMISENLLVAFNPKETVENYGNIDPIYLGRAYDPTEMYSVPYSYGKVGIIYNNTMVDEEDVEDESWSLLWNEKYRGKILQFNNPRDGFATAQFYLGLDINSKDTATWDLARNKLSEQKHLVQSYVSDEIFNKMTSGSAAIGTYYAGDYITMVESNDALSFYYPKEGTNDFIDAMCIPSCSKNRELAIEYINFMLTEEAAVENALYIGYASPNKLVKDNTYYQEEMGEDAIDILYNSEDTNVNYPYDPSFLSFTPELQDYVNGLWESLKTESAIEPWVHVVTALIVGGVIGWTAFSVYLEKKRSRHYRLRDKNKVKKAQ